MGSVGVNLLDIEPNYLAFPLQHAADRGHRSAFIGMDEFLDLSPGLATQGRLDLVTINYHVTD